MEVYEITGYQTGVSREGVNFLQPADSFQNIKNGYIHRQVLQSRRGFKKFSTGYLTTGHLPTRVMGIFQNILTESNLTETLVFDRNFLYRYNEVSNAFDRIDFGGSLAAYTGFNLTENEYYISGTTYPDKNGKNRFVFTGKGMDHVFFYNGTNVLDYTAVADNPHYVPFAGGVLTRAYHVIWFGERINFIAPLIGGTFYPVGMLYSAIRDSDGHGDNFNFSGAGNLQLDTYENIRGASILGDRLVLNLNKSNWTIEKTRDVFNPYFSRKVPSVIGTDASFSMVNWNDYVISVGKTGIIKTNGKHSLLVDNKIPYFTENEINPIEFEQTYGGFNRETSQFMWSYLESSSENTTQNKVLIYNYEEKSWSTYDQRFSCFGETTNGENLTWDQIDENENPAWETWDTTEEIWDKIGLGSEVQKTLAGDNLGFIYELNQDFDDHFVKITGITQASPAVISTEDQSLQIGDEVYINGVVGMTEINGRTALILDRTINTITVGIDTSTSIFDPYVSGGNASKFIDFSAELIPFNPYRANGSQCKVSHIEFLLDTNAGHLYVDLYQDGNSSPFKSNVLIQPTTIAKDREWIAMEVNNTVDFLTIVMRQKSVSEQVRLTSMRIHCEMDGMTTD